MSRPFLALKTSSPDALRNSEVTAILYMLNDSLFHVPYIGQLALHMITDFRAMSHLSPLKRRVISETAGRNFPEESHLHTRRRKNMKSPTGRNVWHN
jgi:hypothetical protein